MTKYVEAAQLSSIQPGQIAITTVGEYTLALTLIDGQPRIFQPLCPHDKASLSEGRIEGCEITCPRHLARFNLNDGSVSAGWYVDNLKLYPSRINGNKIEVDIDAVKNTPPEGNRKVWDFI